MFGYVVPQKRELKIKDYDLYKAVYCSLCYALRDNYGRLSRVLLNYDFVFAAMLGMALSETDNTVCERRCNTNPLKKCEVACESASTELSAAALCVSAYLKLKDDLADERFGGKLAAAFALPIAKRGYRLAQKKHPELTEQIVSAVSGQRETEQKPNVTLDEAADCSANALSAILGKLSDKPDEVRVLERMGYLLGRYVYLADCGDDLADDIKNKRFNPLIKLFSINSDMDNNSITIARHYIREELYLTAGEICDCYALLNPVRYKDILDNIVYLGLYCTANLIEAGKRKGKI